ncbi:Hypothetical predicted protein [Octopus vulgaris]|uniref:Uncharacterized protein n=1 Tax=Octopus vulgaris TaxID=6645 RepID=A0AA36B3V0_OCTVU|nr:Hypothetical predicted protein [Octopus vulgaris]
MDASRKTLPGINRKFITVDESTDLSDTAQLAVFVRRVTPIFQIFEEFIQLISMKETVTEADIFEALLKMISEVKFASSKLIGITSNGTLVMNNRNFGIDSAIRMLVSYIGIRKPELSSGEAKSIKSTPAYNQYYNVVFILKSSDQFCVWQQCIDTINQ